MEGFSLWLQTKKLSPEISCDWTLPLNSPPQQNWDVTGQHPPDLIMVGEFSELKGPLPLLTIPSLNPACKFQHFELDSTHCLCSCHATSGQCCSNNTRLNSTIVENNENEVSKISKLSTQDTDDAGQSKRCSSKNDVENINAKKCTPSCPQNVDQEGACGHNHQSVTKHSQMECSSKCEMNNYSKSIPVSPTYGHIAGRRGPCSHKKRCPHATDGEPSFAHSFSLEDDPFYYGLDLNDLVLKLMSTDYQNFGGVFNLPSDSEVIELDLEHQFRGVSAVVRYVTLCDIHARGFVRPHCIAYLTWDRNKIKTSLDCIRARMKKASEYLKSTNLCWFAWENKKRLADLQYTKERYLAALKNTRKLSQDKTNTCDAACALTPSIGGKFQGASTSDAEFCVAPLSADHNTARAQACSRVVDYEKAQSVEKKSFQRPEFDETKSSLLVVDPDVLCTSTSPQELQNSALLGDLPDVCSGIETFQSIALSTTVPDATAKLQIDSVVTKTHIDDANSETSIANLSATPRRKGSGTTNFSIIDSNPNFSRIQLPNSEKQACTTGLPNSDNRLMPRIEDPEPGQSSQKQRTKICDRNQKSDRSPGSKPADEADNDDLLLSSCSLDSIASQLLDARRTISVIRKHLEDQPEFSEVKELVTVISSSVGSPLHKATSQHGMLEPSYYSVPPAPEDEEEKEDQLFSSCSRSDAACLDFQGDQGSKKCFKNSKSISAKITIDPKQHVDFTAEDNCGNKTVELAELNAQARTNFELVHGKDLDASEPLHRERDTDQQPKCLKSDLACKACAGCRSGSNASGKSHRCELPELYFGSSGRRRYESLRNLRTLSGCGFVSALLELSELHSDVNKSSLALHFETIDSECYLNDPGSLFIGNLPVVKVVDCHKSSWSSSRRSSVTATNSLLNVSRNFSSSSACAENLSKTKTDLKCENSAATKEKKKKTKYKTSVCYDESIVDQVLNIQIDKIGKDKPPAMQDYGEWVLVDGERFFEERNSPSTVLKPGNLHTSELALKNEDATGRGSDPFIVNSPPNNADGALCLLMSASTLSSTSGGSCTVSSSYDTDNKLDDPDPVEVAVAAEEIQLPENPEALTPTPGLPEPCSQSLQQVPHAAKQSEEDFCADTASPAADEIPSGCKPLWTVSLERQTSRTFACCECCTCRYLGYKCYCCSSEESSQPSSSTTAKRKKKKKKYRSHPKVDIERRMAIAYHYGLSDLLLNIPGKSKNKLALSDVSQSLIASLLGGRRLIVAGRSANQRAVEEAVTALAAVLLPVAQDNLHPITTYHRGTVTPHHLHQQPLMGLCIPERLILHDLIDPCTMSKITAVNLSSGHVSGVAYYGSFIRGIADFIRGFSPREADPQKVIRQWSESVPTPLPAGAQIYFDDPCVGNAYGGAEPVRDSAWSGSYVLGNFGNGSASRRNSSGTPRDRNSDSRSDEAARNSQSGAGLRATAKTVSRSVSTPDFANDLFCVNPTGRGGASLLNTAFDAAASAIGAESSVSQSNSLAQSSATNTRDLVALTSRNSPSNTNAFVRSSSMPSSDMLRFSSCSSHRDFMSHPDSRPSSATWYPGFSGTIPSMRETFTGSSPGPLYGNRDAPLQALLQSTLVQLGVQVFLYFHVSGNSTLNPSRLMHVMDVKERNDMQILEYLTSIVARQLDLAGVEVEYLP